MTIEDQNKQKSELYEIKAEFPFDSTRKRMSLIVKHDNKYILMTKGADSIVLPRVYFRPEEERVRRNIEKSLLAFAKEGLRTLVVGQRILNEQEYQRFSEEFYAVQQKQDEELLNEFFDKQE